MKNTAAMKREARRMMRMYGGPLGVWLRISHRAAVMKAGR